MNVVARVKSTAPVSLATARTAPSAVSDISRFPAATAAVVEESTVAFPGAHFVLGSKAPGISNNSSDARRVASVARCDVTAAEALSNVIFMRKELSHHGITVAVSESAAAATGEAAPKARQKMEKMLIGTYLVVYVAQCCEYR